MCLKSIFPNEGFFMVIYHGRIRKKNHQLNTSTKLWELQFGNSLDLESQTSYNSIRLSSNCLCAKIDFLFEAYQFPFSNDTAYTISIDELPKTD